MHIKNQKGFTLIELIVVIAIIAILAVIVLVNVTQYIAKSKNANIEGNLETMQTNATVYTTTNSTSSFAGFSGTTGYTLPQSQVNLNSNATMYEIESATGFCACSILLTPPGSGGTTTYYCVDGTGVKKSETTQACNSECSNSTYTCQ